MWAEWGVQSRWCGFATQLYRLVAVWSLPSDLTLLGIYFLIFKWPLRTKRINRVDLCKALSTELGIKYTCPKNSNCHYQFPAMGGGSRITANRRTIQRSEQLKLNSWLLKGCQLLHNLSLVINIFVTWKEAEFLSWSWAWTQSLMKTYHYSLMSSEKNFSQTTIFIGKRSIDNLVSLIGA